MKKLLFLALALGVLCMAITGYADSVVINGLTFQSSLPEYNLENTYGGGSYTV